MRFDAIDIARRAAETVAKGSTAGSAPAAGEADAFLETLEQVADTVHGTASGGSGVAAGTARQATHHWGAVHRTHFGPRIHGPEGAVTWTPDHSTADASTTAAAAVEPAAPPSAAATALADVADTTTTVADAPAPSDFSVVHGPLHQMPNPGHIMNGATGEDEGTIPGLIATPLTMIPRDEVTDGDVAYAMQQYQAVTAVLGQLNAAFLAPGEMNTSFGTPGS